MSDDWDYVRWNADGYVKGASLGYRSPALDPLQDLLVAVLVLDEPKHESEEQKQRKKERLERARVRDRLRSRLRRLERIGERVRFLQRKADYLHAQRSAAEADWLRGHSLESLDPATVGAQVVQGVVDRHREQLKDLQYRLRYAYLHSLPRPRGRM